MTQRNRHQMDPEQEQPSCKSGTWSSIMDEIPDYKRSMQADVEIFVAGSPYPIRTSALLLANSSPLLASLLHQISFCAGCPAARTLILDDDKEAVRGLVTWVEQTAFQEVDPREDFALLPPTVQEQVVSLSHRLQLVNPPSETEVKVEVLEEFPTNTVDWQIQISEIHSIGEEVNRRDQMKKKLRNKSTDTVSPKSVEPINGKIQSDPQKIKSVTKQDSVETVAIKRDKKDKHEPAVLSVEVKKESLEDQVLFTEDGSSDLLSRSLNEAYKKMTTGSSSSSTGRWKALEAHETLLNCREEKRPIETLNPDSVSTIDSGDLRKKKAHKLKMGGPHLETGKEGSSRRGNKQLNDPLVSSRTPVLTKTESSETHKRSLPSVDPDVMIASPRSGGRKHQANTLQVEEAEHELVVVKREKLAEAETESQSVPKESRDLNAAEVTKRLVSPRRAKERSVAIKDLAIKTEPGKDNTKDSLKIKLKFSKQSNKSSEKKNQFTKEIPEVKSEIKNEPNDHIMFNEKTMEMSFFTEANLRSVTEEQVLRDVESNLKVWVSKYHGPSIVPAKRSKNSHSSPKPLPITKPKEETKTFKIKIKKEPEGQTSVESYQKSPAKPKQSQKSNSCGQCKGCQNTKDCGKCLNCLDNVKFGGKAVRRLRCSKRMCKASLRSRKILESLPPVQTCAECNIEVLGGREPYEKHMLLWHEKYFSNKHGRFFSVKEDRKLKVKVRRSNEPEMEKPKKESMPAEGWRKKKRTKRSNEKEPKQRRSLIAIQHTCDTDQMVDVGLRKNSL